MEFRMRREWLPLTCPWPFACGALLGIGCERIPLRSWCSMPWPVFSGDMMPMRLPVGRVFTVTHCRKRWLYGLIEIPITDANTDKQKAKEEEALEGGARSEKQKQKQTRPATADVRRRKAPTRTDGDAQSVPLIGATERRVRRVKGWLPRHFAEQLRFDDSDSVGEASMGTDD